MINDGPTFPYQVLGATTPILAPAPSAPLAPPPLSKLALWAFICAMVGFVILPAFAAAVVLGFVAITRPALKNGAVRGRGLAKSAIAIALVMSVLSVAIIWVAVGARLSTARNQVANSTALAIGFDATAIAAINEHAPTIGSLVVAIGETNATATLVSANGRPVQSATASNPTVLSLAKLSIHQPQGPVDVCLTFSGKVNAIPKVLPCS